MSHPVVWGGGNLVLVFIGAKCVGKGGEKYSPCLHRCKLCVVVVGLSPCLQRCKGSFSTLCLMGSVLSFGSSVFTSHCPPNRLPLALLPVPLKQEPTETRFLSGVAGSACSRTGLSLQILVNHNQLQRVTRAWELEGRSLSDRLSQSLEPPITSP